MSKGLPDNLVELLEPRAALAIVDRDGSTWSHAELADRVARLAAGLAARGVGPGDRIVVLIPMSRTLYQVLLALFHLGASAVLVDPGAPLQDKLSAVAPTGLIGVPRAHLLRLKVPALRGLRHLVSTGPAWLPARRLSRLEASGPPPPPCPEPGPALITFTSGTTGAPKVMARSHAMLLAQHHALSGHMALGPGDVDLPTLPVFLLHSLAGGATCVIPDVDLRAPDAIDAAALVHQIRAQGVTSSSGSPALFARLADWLEAQDQRLPELRRLFMGGARVPASLVRRLEDLLPQASQHIVYGSTEAEPIAFLDARAHTAELEEGQARGALVGRAVPELALRFQATQGAEGPDRGELLVAGEHVNPGYLDNPEADAQHKVHEALPDGSRRTWHRTGDVGFTDEDGRIWLLGRVGEQVGGLWPLPTEAAAEALAFVGKAGLVDLDGEPVLACTLTAEAPPDWEARITEATGVRRVRRVARLPVDLRHNAKVDRVALHGLLSAPP